MVPLEKVVAKSAPESAAPRFSSRRAAIAFASLLAVAIGLALAWTHTPLADLITRDNATALARSFAGLWWAPLAVILVYTPASLIMFPRWLITMTAVLAFGPWNGFAYAMAGVVLAGIASYLPGRLIGRDTVRRLAGPRLQRVAGFMERRGLVAVTLVRLFPVAPFPVVNLTMGALRVKLTHLVLGTMLGMLPGMLAATVLSDQLAEALEDPARVNGWLVAAALLVLGILAYFGQRWMRRHPQ